MNSRLSNRRRRTTEERYSRYRFVETKKLPNGDTEHVYEKVKTSHKDKEGNEIPGHPSEDGEQPKKDIPGYEFIKTILIKMEIQSMFTEKRSLHANKNQRVKHQLRALLKNCLKPVQKLLLPLQLLVSLV